MRKERIIIALIFSFVTLLALADTFVVTSQQQKKITDEAEDWIDNMPDGLQDKMSDAVNHALHGFFSEATYFRNIADTVGSSKYRVNIKDIYDMILPARLYSPQTSQNSEKLPLLIYFHGGGWSLGSLNTSDKFCRALAAGWKLKVISIDYPLAPEHPYPQALLQTEAAVEDIIKNASQIGVDPSEISLGGDGAGGNLALAVYEKLPASVKIKSLVLYYPLVDINSQIEPNPKRMYGRGYGFDTRLWEAFVEAYNGKDLTLNKSLPSTLLIAPSRDIIIEKERNFSGIGNIKFVELEGALHGFISDGHQPTAFQIAVTLTDKFLSK